VLLIRDLHLCPELAVVLQVTLNLAREVVLSVEVVHVQNVLAFRWADVIRGVARWERMGHRGVVGSSCALRAWFQVVTSLEHEALHVVLWGVLYTVHCEEVTLIQVQAVLLTTEVVYDIKVEDVDDILLGDWTDSRTEGAVLVVLSRNRRGKESQSRDGHHGQAL